MLFELDLTSLVHIAEYRLGSNQYLPCVLFYYVPNVKFGLSSNQTLQPYFNGEIYSIFVTKWFRISSYSL